MSSYITDESALVGSLPFSISRNDDKERLAEAIAAELVKLVGNTDCAAIFPRVDELPEQVLDILAYDLKIDWYEPSAPIANKRRAVKEAMFVHRYKGTKYAVETALHSVFQSAEVQEWFEYGGEPFHFKLTVYGGSGSSNLKSLVARIQYAKNLRSVMDMVEFTLEPDGKIEAYFGAKIAGIIKNLQAKITAEFDGFAVTGSYSAGMALAGRERHYTARMNYNEGDFSVSGDYSIGAKTTYFVKKMGG